MKKQRKRYTPEEKVAILRRCLLEQVPISELCDQQGLQPTVFYRWQKEFFENGAAAFQPKARPHHSAEQERIAYLEKKIQTKDEVLAELMAEHVALKKNAWGTLTVWVPHDTRDQIVDFVRRWSEKTEIAAGRFIGWLDVAASKFYDWRERYGRVPYVLPSCDTWEPLIHRSELRFTRHRLLVGALANLYRCLKRCIASMAVTICISSPSVVIAASPCWMIRLAEICSFASLSERGAAIASWSWDMWSCPSTYICW
jgi:transposase